MYYLIEHVLHLPVGDLEEPPIERDVLLNDRDIVPHAGEELDRGGGCVIAEISTVDAPATVTAEDEIVSLSMGQDDLRSAPEVRILSIKCRDDAAREASEGCRIYQLG